MQVQESMQNIDSKASCYLVRLGLHGQVGRFRLAEPISVRRRDRVVCRTARGLEIGHILGTSESQAEHVDSADGRVLRRMTPEDELLWGHLRQLGQDAHAACQTWLQEHDSGAVLLEVEPLLDGKTLYFHFLSDVDDCVQEQLDELVQIYEQQVRESKFANLLEHGCGPGCGTASAKNGCGSRGGCAVCKIATSCAKKSAE